MKVLLLNPPGRQLYVRDYYCSKTSKANYIYQPIDLLLLSGILASQHQVEILDAIVEQLPPQKCLEIITEKKPDVIMTLTGAVSIKEDIPFFEEVKKRIGNKPVYASGDILMENGVEFLERLTCIDGIILDFTSNDILKLLAGAQESLDTIIYRKGANVIRQSGKILRGEFEIPVPKHEIFPNHRYTYPFITNSPFATVLTDYGCPYKCSFCIMGTLPYKYRSIRNVIEELEHIRALGIREIYFGDQTFGVIKKRGIELCRAMIEREFNFGWVCFSRADITDEEMLRVMKEAGCHTIIYGVETGSEEILKQYNKDITKEDLRNVFALCKKYGIKTVGTFVLGLPEDDEESILKTIGFAKELDCDYASFNVYVPRMHTKLREEVLRLGLVSAETEAMDQSGSYSVIGTKYLSSEEVLRLKNRAVREFYLRPSYLIKRLSYLRSLREIKREFRGGIGVLKDIARNYIR